jgi:hypothetical protein
MATPGPILAIVGSARAEIVGDQEPTARAACQALGQELARAGWRLAVYSSEATFIEAAVVSGFVAAGAAGEGSILCYYPHGAAVHFAEMDTHDRYFREFIDASSDWEVAFYRSLAQVDGILLLGGGSSTLIAGHIALSRSVPILAIAHFGGEAKKIWQHLASKPAFIQDSDVQAMARWHARSAQECVASLVAQHERRQASIVAEQRALQAIREKAAQWDSQVTEEMAHAERFRWAIGFLLIFILLLIVGLTVNRAGWLYTTIVVLGLCAAGGMGATIRMLTPGAPNTRKSAAPLIGIAVGLVFSLLYLVPQLIGDASFLVPHAAISGATRVQYISSLIVGVLAGLGFDYALEQLLSRARERGQEIVRASP